MAIQITYFVHGTTTDNEKHLATGWAGGELSEKGIQQAKELGPLVAGKHFDVIFCSDLKRAIDSANLNFPNREIIQDSRLRECNYGDFAQQPVDSFEADMTKWVDKPYPNGESYKDVETRIADFLEFLKKNYQQEHIALVAHQAPQLALDVLLKGKTWQQAIAEDWHCAKAWQPGWEYTLE
ncbi:histidine phosphatase family protein [bacterium (Candidatus Gribaldobacteria) CG10_big_fil_rev_8_21_14_0_10_37_21]|uniref:Histidine phosphatase family protein n=1 Tax=bacterium (Candidatus Gribaldobacteria) CG10_big_fil_rev_8_21_14_0_10_37_21 TaxID=2014275 RepID=A0A2H0UVF6_9BACT|nr:MAG: histidine phosphatase family protein [bacterium (Candidatus Gribaldobacteria) CG10_big_fil_rev_8_21_14_0_10_37_21]